VSGEETGVGLIGEFALDLEVAARSGIEGVGQMTRRYSLPVLGLVLLFLPVVKAGASARPGRDIEQTETKQVVLKGRVTCVEASGRAVSDQDDCSTESAKFLFHSKDGRTYNFVADDALTAMFTDHRVRERDLQLTAWERAKSRLELVAIQSVKNGKLYDIYYYCDICNITAYAPGPCPCCRRELEFKEAPAPEP
jgi:hypothetical protein